MRRSGQRAALLDLVKASTPKTILDYIVAHPDEVRGDAALAACILATLQVHDSYTMRARALLNEVMVQRETT